MVFCINFQIRITNTTFSLHNSLDSVSIEYLLIHNLCSNIPLLGVDMALKAHILLAVDSFSRDHIGKKVGYGNDVKYVRLLESDKWNLSTLCLSTDVSFPTLARRYIHKKDFQRTKGYAWFEIDHSWWLSSECLKPKDSLKKSKVIICGTIFLFLCCLSSIIRHNKNR